jgi:hypothetical protein
VLNKSRAEVATGYLYLFLLCCMLLPTARLRPNMAHKFGRLFMHTHAVCDGWCGCVVARMVL